MLCYLRIAFSSACGMLCLMLLASWAESYSFYDKINLLSFADRTISVAATQGHVTFGYWGPSWDRPTDWGIWHQRVDEASKAELQAYYRDRAFTTRDGCSRDVYVIMPHWCPLLLLSAAAGIPWIAWSKRFSLRTLLIVTTLIAVVLGAIAASN